MTEIIWLKMASEPIINKFDARSNGYWTMLSVADQSVCYEFGDERGQTKCEEFSVTKGIGEAGVLYGNDVAGYDMDEDSMREIREENNKVTAYDIARALMSAGDYLTDNQHGGMDGFLEYWREQMKGVATWSYKYKNIYSDANGFLARVVVRRRKTKTRKGSKCLVWIDGSDLGHMVKNIEEI